MEIQRKQLVQQGSRPCAWPLVPCLMLFKNLFWTAWCFYLLHSIKQNQKNTTSYQHLVCALDVETTVGGMTVEGDYRSPHCQSWGGDTWPTEERCKRPHLTCERPSPQHHVARMPPHPWRYCGKLISPLLFDGNNQSPSLPLSLPTLLTEQNTS